MPRPTIVLFDMDGTTVRHINPRLLGTLEFLDDTSFKIASWLHRKKPHPDFTLDKIKKPRLLVHRALHRFRRKDVEQIVQPCPGIYTLLGMFRDEKIPLGIVSNGLGKGYGHDILTKFNLSDFFKVQIFREDIQHSKPHPDPILRALAQIKDPLTNSDVVWYIGDRHKDVIAALAANDALPARIIPFAYGLKAAVAILEKGLSPDNIIMNYTDFAARIYPVIKDDIRHHAMREDDED
ncbi:MAG: HAD family hydrolase [Micavibrio aeruginosavorus]|uniref:phosphoglycolate phosphatase n=1 Tax=Micavibrio aeruginosavorus TaxID=349221 RepID=A0A2W5MWF9_9BACT|nr:MAG: HAD family hydrolase [Micavibrio aeruginosavorus]